MGLFLPIIVTLIWLYVLWRVILKLPINTISKIFLAALLLIIANYHQIVGRYFGSFASPELPRPILIVLAWAFGTFLLIALLALLRDLVALIFRLPFPRFSVGLLSCKRTSVFILCLSVLLSAFGVWQAVKVPFVKTIGLKVKNLPDQFVGYRIAQLSDMHASRLLPASWQAAVVAKTNKIKPDLIVITGDLADGSVSQRQHDIEPLSDLQAKDGVIAVPGNHEYYTDYVSWIKALRALGLTVLENQKVTMHHDGADLVVAGLTDRQANSFAQTPPDISKALADVPKDTPVVLLQHRPDDAKANAKAGVAVQLSGHTHGGQIWGPNILTKMANDGFLSGVYNVGAMKLYVSNGTGLWHGLAIRLGVRSEITEIILKK